MKTIALVVAVLMSTTFVLEPSTASAGSSVSRWIQLGLSAANTARSVQKTRQGGGLLSNLNKGALNPQPLPPKLFRRY